MQPTFADDTKQTARVAAPLIGSRVLHVLNDFVNMILIAKLGVLAMATGAIIFSTTATLLIMARSMLYAIGVIVGRIFATEKQEDIGKVTTASLLIALCLGVFFSFFSWHIDKVLLLLHQPPDLVAQAKPYFQVFALGIIPSLGITCFYELVMGVLRSRLVIIWDLFATPVNIFLAYCLLFGKFGFPHLGIVGAACAFAVTYWGLFVGVTVYFYCNKKYKIFKLFTFDYEKVMHYGKNHPCRINKLCNTH